MNRWQLYELLKGDNISAQVIAEVEKMEIGELKEGVLEFLLMKHRK